MSRILIVDNSVMILKVLRTILENEGHTVLDAPNGKIGLKLMKKNQTDLVITEINMPEMDGLLLISLLKRYFPDINIIAMSGGSKTKCEGYLKMAKKMGATFTCTKPIDQIKLLNGINKILR